jgi:hypothetical protein
MPMMWFVPGLVLEAVPVRASQVLPYSTRSETTSLVVKDTTANVL